MNRYFIVLVTMLFLTTSSSSQEITETNTDKLYESAREQYQAGNFKSALAFTQKGLGLASNYHDIRILQVRILWALDEIQKADEHLDYLLHKASGYVDVKPLALQRIKFFTTPQQTLEFVQELTLIFPESTDLQVKKADLLLKSQRPMEARDLAKQLLGRKISGADRYLLQNIVNRTIRNSIGVNYQYIHFSDDYSRSGPWNSLNLEYQRSIGRTTLLARTTFSDRRYADGILYEVEAYPVFNDRAYAFLNGGFSNSEIFPHFRGSVSFYYNFAKIFEAEAGSRLQYFGSTYITGIAGLTLYSGKFYLNTRIFLGPERNDQLLQNYQFNTRYYLKNADNYLFLRIGSGISPDETSLSTLQLEDPTLDAWYTNIGINQTLGVHHIIQVAVGLLHEDITVQRSGTQFTGSLGYRYNF